MRPRVAHLKIGNPLEVEYLLDPNEHGTDAIRVQKVWAYGGAVKVDVTATLELVGAPVMARVVQEIADLEAAKAFARRKA